MDTLPRWEAVVPEQYGDEKDVGEPIGTPVHVRCRPLSETMAAVEAPEYLGRGPGERSPDVSMGLRITYQQRRIDTAEGLDGGRRFSAEAAPGGQGNFAGRGRRPLPRGISPVSV